MTNVKCTMCGAMVSSTLANCDTCGNPLAPQAGFGSPAPQSGFGSPAPQSGFGSPVPQSGFGSPAPQSGFGGQAPQTGFGQSIQPSGFGQPAQPTGFGQPTDKPAGFGQPAQPAGFGQPAQPTGFGGQGGFGGPPKAESSGFGSGPAFPTPPSYDAKPKQGFQGVAPDEARFAETVGAQGNMNDSIYWGFKQSLIFLLKCLIPVYGLVLLIMCVIGNPRKYPTIITNYIRASLVVSVIIMVVTIILTLALGAGAASILAGL